MEWYGRQCWNLYHVRRRSSRRRFGLFWSDLCQWWIRMFPRRLSSLSTIFDGTVHASVVLSISGRSLWNGCDRSRCWCLCILRSRLFSPQRGEQSEYDFRMFRWTSTSLSSLSRIWNSPIGTFSTMSTWEWCVVTTTDTVPYSPTDTRISSTVRYRPKRSRCWCICLLRPNVFAPVWWDDRYPPWMFRSSPSLPSLQGVWYGTIRPLAGLSFLLVVPIKDPLHLVLLEHSTIIMSNDVRRIWNKDACLLQ